MTVNYWKTFQKKLILDKISSLHGRSLQMWQHSEKERVQVSGTCQKVDSEEILTHISDINPELLENEALYVRSLDLGLIFKVDHFILEKETSLLKCSYPEVISLPEKRGEIRAHYFASESQQMKIFLGDKQITGMVVNISDGGCAFVVSFADNLLEIGKKYVVRLDGFDEMRIQLIHIEDSYEDFFSSKEMVFVGAKWDEELKPKYKQEIDQKLKKREGFLEDLPGGLILEDQIEALNKISKSNLVLANNIKENISVLERLRGVHERQLNVLITNFETDLFAVALRLSSREVVHDVLSLFSKNIREDLLYKMNEKKSAAGICKAQDKFVNFLKEKEQTGEFVFEKDKNKFV